MGAAPGAPATAPSAITSPAEAPSVVASSGRGVRTKTMAEEADIKGFDWAGAAARAATAFEPQAVESSAPALSVGSFGPFDTLAASGVLKRDIVRPNVTASTAISLPTITLPDVQLPTLQQPAENIQLPSVSLPSLPALSLPQTSIDALSQQKIMQATFGSVLSPGLSLPAGMDTSNMSWNVPREASNIAQPVFASANSSIRGSRFQPGSMPDSKSTSTVVDTAPGQVAVGQSVVGQMAAQLQSMPAQMQQGAGTVTSTTTTSSVGA
jgi:hypothetical protein